jgi:hypothetical protein
MATQSGMTNKWLSEQGLISVKDQWGRTHITRPRPGNLDEMPCADPHAGCRGAGGLKNPRLPDWGSIRYPIISISGPNKFKQQRIIMLICHF